MTQYDYDLFIIGAGSGGVRMARMAAAQGVRIAVAEDSKAGGTCVNRGCIPKKLYVYAAEYSTFSQDSSNFGWDIKTNGFDWSTLRDNKSSLISQSNKRMEALITDAGADLIFGRATVTGPHQVSVDGRTYSAERILIATGGVPTLPAFEGHEHLLTSDQIFDLDRLPEKMVIIGGGYIACEFAGIFHNLGVKVTQLYRGDLFLRGFDVEIRKFVATRMQQKGIDLRFNNDVDKVIKTSDGRYEIELKSGQSLTADVILAATGRHPNVSGLGLEEAGVKLNERGAVIVDHSYRSSVPSIYALGDVIDRIQLTPVALAEAMTLLRNLYQGQSTKLDYSLIPTAVFSLPPIANVGLTEEQAMEKYQQVDVYSTEFKPLKHALSDSPEKILMKLLVDGASQRVIGAHMAGEGAAETIQGIAIALKAGATKTVFDQTIGIHPTSAEEFVTMRSITRSHTRKES